MTKEDIGISIMYKDFYMTGWSCRDVTADDVKLMPIIGGRGKQCRQGPSHIYDVHTNVSSSQSDTQHSSKIPFGCPPPPTYCCGYHN